MAIVSVLASFLLYANTLPGQFVFDDFQFTRNPLFYKFSFIPRLLFRSGTPQVPISGYRPLSYMTMALQLSIFGEQPMTFHIVSIFLNTAAVLLVFAVTDKLLGSFRLALLTALLFAFLPIHTENVAYIKARDDLLSTVLVLVSWFLLLHGKRWWSGLVFLLAVLAKELVFFAPILYFFAPKPIKMENQQIKTSHFHIPLLSSYFSLLYSLFPHLLAVMIYAVFRIMAFGPFAFSGNAISSVFNPLGFADSATRFWTNLKITAMYIAKTFIPYNLSAGYQYNHFKLVSHPFDSWEAWLGLLAIITFTIFILHPKTRKTPLGVGAIAFGALFIPLPKILFQGADIFSERWMYGPSVGLALIGGSLINLLIGNSKIRAHSEHFENPSEKRKAKNFILYAIVLHFTLYVLRLFQNKRQFITWTVFVVILIIYASTIIPRNLIWRNQRTLFTSMVEDAPDNIYAWYLLARDYYGTGDLDTAARLAGYALEIDPDFPYPELLYLQSQIAYHRGDYGNAKEILQKATGMVDHATQIHGMYALMLAKQGHFQDAINYISSKRLQLDENDPWIRIIVGGSYFAQADMENAKKYLGWDETKNDFLARSQLDNFLATATAVPSSMSNDL